jgi:probable phosphoglycerate mutase
MGSLFLARHATTEASAAGRNLGRRDDPPLAAEGVALAARLGSAIALELDDLPRPGSGALRIVSSSARRCRQTTASVAGALADAGYEPGELETHAGLIEIDYGRWDGLTPEECRARDPEHRERWEADPFATRCPDGESGGDVAARSFPIFDELERWLSVDVGRTAVVVAHNHVNRVRLCHILGWPMRGYRDRISQDPGGYNLVTFSGEGAESVVRRVNATAPPGPLIGR